MTNSGSGSIKLPLLLFTMSVFLFGTNIYLYHKKLSTEKEQDLISNHPHNLSVAVMKTIYENMDPYFRLDKIDQKWYLNDPQEILSNEIDLFYVPK
jgi:hypothetical protein